MKKLRIRQGAIIIHIAEDAQISYELSIAVPMNYNSSSATIVYGKKTVKMVKEFHKEWKDVMKAKLQIQFDVQVYKNQLGLERAMLLLNKKMGYNSTEVKLFHGSIKTTYDERI